MVGDVADDAAAGLGAYGAKKVYRAKDVPEGLAQPIVDAMAKVMTDNDIDYALFGGGLLGFEIGAGLTARLNAGVTMEVTEVKAQDGKLVAERPILQDSQIADVGYVDEPGIIIGRLNAFDINEAGGTAEVEDVDVELSEWSTKAKMVKRGEQRGDDVNIEDADILVGGGRGLGKAENFELAEHLAEAMGGAVAATRAVVDAGWYPYAAQIGQTGKTVAPKLYLARRDLRRDPAQGRHAGLREHRRDQQGPERADLRVLRPRDRRRPAQDHPQADRGDQGEEGLEPHEREWPVAQRTVAPVEFPPPVDSGEEFVGPPTDRRGRAHRGRRRDRRRRPGRARLRDPLMQLLEDEPELTEKLGEVPVAVIEKGKTPRRAPALRGEHAPVGDGGAVPRPGPVRVAGLPGGRRRTPSTC